MASYSEVSSFCCRCEGGWLQLEGSARVCGRNQRFDRPVVLFSDKPIAILHMQWVQYHYISVSEQFLRYILINQTNKFFFRAICRTVNFSF